MAEKVKIARQGMTWRHIAIVVTMCLSIFTAVGIIFTAAGLCYRPVAQHFGVPVSQVSLYITFVYLGQIDVYKRQNPRRFKAETLAEWGYAVKVVPDEEVVEEAVKMCIRDRYRSSSRSVIPSRSSKVQGNLRIISINNSKKPVPL